MSVGISVLIGLKAATLFILFLPLRYSFPLLSILILYASLISVLVAIASHPSIDLPILVGKGSDGSFSIVSLIIFSPYLYFVRAFSSVRRFASGESPYTQISPGIYVGAWPYSTDTLPPGNPAIIDCTCEFPRLIQGHAYFCLPTWDTRAPHPAQIESAVNWACRKRAATNAPVFVHCALGIIKHFASLFLVP